MVGVIASVIEMLEVLYFGLRRDLRESTIQNIESSCVRFKSISLDTVHRSE
jgi:hypothetical protein